MHSDPGARKDGYKGTPNDVPNSPTMSTKISAIANELFSRAGTELVSIDSEAL